MVAEAGADDGALMALALEEANAALDEGDARAWCGGVVVWWCGGVVVWWCGGVVVWWCGGVVVCCDASVTLCFQAKCPSAVSSRAAVAW